MPGMIARTWETAETPPAPTANMRPVYVSIMSNMDLQPNELGNEAYYSLEGAVPAPLFLRHCCQFRTGVDDLKPATYFDFMTTGPRVAGWKNLMLEFWGAWALAGSMRPTRIVLEFEQHYTWYAISGDSAVCAAAIQAVRDAGYSKRYPAELNAFTQAQLAAHNNHNSPTARALVLHDMAVKQRMNKALADIVLGTYATIFGTPPPPCSNYDDVRLRDGYTSAWGYTYPGNKVVCVGSDSSPELYFNPNGARYSAISGSGPKQFAATKGMIELIRACRGKVVPWVGPPGYRGEGFPKQTSSSAWAGWRKFIHTLALHGIDEVLYFIGNYAHETGEREYADETFRTAIVATPKATHRWNKPVIDTSTLLTGTGGYVEAQFAYNAGDWS